MNTYLTGILFVLSGILLLNLAVLSGINGVLWGLVLGGKDHFQSNRCCTAHEIYK